ncbi:MAG: hypothetical protein ACTSQ0_06760, partial [Candidatus Heimdallarchaeota archaeon]
MRKKWKGYLLVIGVMIFFTITNSMFINGECTNSGAPSLLKQNSTSEKNSFLQTQELPESYIEYLTSANFILLMIVCFLCLIVPITILIQFSIEKRQKIKEEKPSLAKKDFKLIDSRKKALDFIQMDSINLIKYGFIIFLLLLVIDGIFTIIEFSTLSYYIFPEAPIPFGVVFFNYLSTFLPIVFEIIAGLLIGIGFIKLSREDTQKKQLATLGIFWLIWTIFSPFLKIALFIVFNNLEYLIEYDSFLSNYFWFNNSVIFFTFTILFVLRFSITSLILYFSAKILQEKELIKTKWLLIASSLLIWFLSSVIYIIILVFETVPLKEGTLYYSLQMLIGSFFFASMVISPIIAIIAVITLIKEFKTKQKKEKEILIRSKHDISSLSDIYTN